VGGGITIERADLVDVDVTITGDAPSLASERRAAPGAEHAVSRSGSHATRW